MLRIFRSAHVLQSVVNHRFMKGVCFMLRLNEGNVLLKPSHRKQMMSWLKRILRLGERLGDFVLTINLQRSGKSYHVRANVHDAAGDFDYRCKQQDWRSALREVVRNLMARVHEQYVHRGVAT
jgi:hypothetical protein